MYGSGLEPDWKSIIDMALVVCPIDFMLTDGVRKAEDQFELYKIGRVEKAGGWCPKYEDGRGIVTYADGYKVKSKHQRINGFGMAVDVAAYVPGKKHLAYDRLHLGVIISAFITCANTLYHEQRISYILRSGADWDRDTEWLEKDTFHDLPHLELIKP